MIIDILIASGVMLLLGAILGIVLAIASIYLQVKVDARYEAVLGMLPGLNCGVCGHPGCAGMTTSLLDGSEKKISACRPSKQEAREKIKQYLDKTPGLDGKVVTVEI